MAKTLKVTFTLDAETVTTLKAAADRTGRPQSAIVRDAIARYGERHDKLNPAERQRMLEALQRMMASPPTRTDPDAEAEVKEIRRARRDDRHE